MHSSLDFQEESGNSKERKVSDYSNDIIIFEEDGKHANGEYGRKY